MAKILFATKADGTKFYPITIADAVAYIKQDNTQVRLSDFLDAIDYTGKADKVSGAVTGNFAGLDANGNLTDSGSKASDFKTVQTAVTDPTASGNATSFIDSISQNTNGEITATKKTIPTVTASVSGAGGNDGLMTAAQAEALAAIDYSGKADKVASATSGNFAGLDGNGNLTDSGSKASDFDAAGAAAAVVGASGDASTANTVYGAKAYADSLATNYDAAGAADTAEQNAKNYADGLASNYDAAGTAAGLIEALDATVTQTAGTDGLALSVTEADGVITAVSGSIAANTYDAYGAASTVKSEVIGASTDLSSADTIYGAKKYADEAVASGLVGAVTYKGTVDGTNGLPASDYKKGDLYVVAAAGTYAGKACEIGDWLLANKDYASGATAANDWDAVSGENQVDNKNASLTIGTAVTIATVDGTDITVTQVEDETKIEAVAVADTTDYPDVTSLFTAA